MNYKGWILWTRLRYISLFIWMIPQLTSAQHGHKIPHIYDNANHLEVVQYAFDDTFEHIVLASGFSKESIQHIPFTDRRIFKIDLVYTTYRENDEFDQRALDIARIEKLVEINPQIVDNKFFDWNIIGQTGCQSSISCQNYFHGFVIYYEPYYTKEITRTEIDSINKEMSNLDKKIIEYKELLEVNYERIDCEYPESYYTSEYLSDKLGKMLDCDHKFKGRVFFDVRMDFKGRPLDVTVKGNLFPCKAELAKSLKYILKWKRGLIIGHQQYDLTASGFVIFPLEKESVQIGTFIIDDHLKSEYQMLQQYSQCVAYNTDTSYVEIIPKVTKRVVSDVIIRNKWQPKLAIVDVTGSMYPYTADMLKWVKLACKEEIDFVFFNDGDDRSTSSKIIGSTGGLYHVRSADYRMIRDKMYEAMRAGGGGDLPENNFEALLYGEKNKAGEGEIIMIADNYATPRDISLLASYKGKIRIILCHTEKGINTEYLDIARKHGFSIHSLKSDLIDLSKNRVTIDGVSYYINGGKYVRGVNY